MKEVSIEILGIVAALIALFAGGTFYFVRKSRIIKNSNNTNSSNRVSDNSTSVIQTNNVAGGDIVGRDKTNS